MEYKRLTEKTIGCFQYDLKDFKHKVGEFSDYDTFFTYSMAVKRLGELEDKIEAGTLIELSYKVGQELYCVWYGKEVEKVKVSLITIKHNGDIDIRLNHYYKNGYYWSCSKYDPKHHELFNTEAEAEKKLEEIKNGK